MSIRLGLTGSIGMGKSTTAGFFRELGVPVWDADAAVAELYAPGGAAVAPVAALCPAARRAEGGLDKSALKAWIAKDTGALAQLEAVVHPLVAEHRLDFASQHRDAPLLVFDIPLYFETGGREDIDAVLVVTAAPKVQRARVMARPGMTEAHFQTILDRQMPDAEKRDRADYVIETRGLEQTRQAVKDLCAALLEQT